MEHWIERADGPPPPYPTTSAPPTALPTAGTPDPLSQFRRYIIEIMAFTFDADFAKLNQALDQTPSPMNPKSILRAEEHDKLLALAMLVKEMLPKVSEGSTHQLTVRAGDRKTIADAIIRPALFLGIPAVYTLKIIRSYSAHRCDPSKRSLSSISEEKPWGFNFWLSLRWLTPLNIILWGFEQDLWSHARIVELAIPYSATQRTVNTKNRIFSTPHNSTNMDPIDAAVEALKSLELGKRPNISQVAREYGVERSRLSKRYRGVQGTYATRAEKKRLLNNTQEKQLLQYIDKLCVQGLPPTREMIRNFAGEIAHQEPGNHWVNRYIARHQIDLISRWTSGIDSQRYKADSAFKYALYFKLLDDKIKQYNIAPSNIYNMDEKGFLIGVVSKMKRVFSRQRYEQGGVKQVLQDGNREWITTIACICADGSSLKPALIYQAASGNIQDTWLQDFNPQEHQAFFASSPSGWTNNELGIAWLKRCFQEETKKKAKRDYRLLILDGHGSHVTMEFIEFCNQNRILLAIYPPHSTHTLQPLDVCLFKPLSAAYTKELSEFMYNSQGLTSITKRDFFRFFYKAYRVAFAKETIINAFKVTGISPLNSNAILKKFKDLEPKRPSSSDSTSSVLSASDWRKIEGLLRQVVEDLNDKRVSQLSHTIHAIATQKQLVQHENDRLRDALFNEKKRRKRGKALLLEPSENYAGGAVFWSPSKVEAARNRQAEKDAKAEELQHQKERDKLAKEQKKQEKQAMLEQRAQKRMAAKEVRLQEQQRKAAEREEDLLARAAEKQLRTDIQLAKKGKARSLEAPAPPAHVIEDLEVDVEDLLVIEGVVEASGPSTRTRKVRLPQRYHT